MKHSRDEDVTANIMEMVEQMQRNAKLAREVIETFCKNLPKKRTPSPIDQALSDAVITAPDRHDKALLAKLDAVAGRLLKSG